MHTIPFAVPGDPRISSRRSLKIRTRRGATLPRRKITRPKIAASGKARVIPGRYYHRTTENKGFLKAPTLGGYPFGDPELPGRQSGRFLHRHAVEDQQLAMYRIPVLALTHRSISR